MLDQGPYAWCHNSVLRIIMDTLKDVCDQPWNFYCNLAGAQKIAGTTSPPDILPSQQRPDLVLINGSQNQSSLLSSLFPLSKTFTKLMSTNTINMQASAVICENRVMTPSSFVLKLIAEGSLLILINAFYNLYFL